MIPPIHIKTYRMPLRSKLLDWLENNPQQIAAAEQWFAMLNNLKCVKREEIERANLPRSLTKLSEKSDVPITKADEEKLHPLFVRLFAASHTLGYRGFKNASRHIYSSLEEKFGNYLTSKFSIEHYRNAYSEFHGGIDDDEVNYCYLSGKRINKSDLMAAIQQELEHCQPIIQSRWQFEFRPSLEMKKVVDAMPENAESMAYQYLDHALEFYRHPSFGYWIIKTDYENSETQAPNWIVLSPYGNLVNDRSFPTPEEALDEMDWSIRARFAGYKKEMPYTAFEEYTFPGGSDYQEWLICLPNWLLPYCDRHFRQQQLLIHIRTTERFDWDDKRILMIEEIQSPWHADIRTCGSTRDKAKVEYDDLVADAPFGKEWQELALKAAIWVAIQQGYSNIGFTTGEQQCERWWDMEGLKHLYDRDIPKCLDKLSAQFGCENSSTVIFTNKPCGKIRYIDREGWVIQYAKNDAASLPVKHKEVALFALEKRSEQVMAEVRALNISDTLKQAMTTGEIPLFGW